MKSAIVRNGLGTIIALTISDCATRKKDASPPLCVINIFGVLCSMCQFSCPSSRIHLFVQKNCLIKFKACKAGGGRAMSIGTAPLCNCRGRLGAFSITLYIQCTVVLSKQQNVTPFLYAKSYPRYSCVNFYFCK